MEGEVMGDDYEDEMRNAVRLFARRLDQLIDDSREQGLLDEAIADVLEDAAGALRAGLS
jgi:hypothetical protein